MPSLVFFFDPKSEVVLLTCLRDGAGDGEWYCEGREECEVRAGAFRNPSGSFRRFARRRTEPNVVISMFDGDARSRTTDQVLHGFPYHSERPCSIS